MDQRALYEFLMKGLPVGRIMGIRIRLHFLLLLSLLLIYAHGVGESIYLNGVRQQLGYGWALPYALAVAAILFGSVLAHELGHCYGARLVGGYATEIILWPLGGLALIGGTNRNPKTELIVTILGPAVSVALAIVGYLLYLLFVYLEQLAPFWGWFAMLTGAIAAINTILAVFNLCFPLFPMDSARIIRALLSFRYNPQKVTYYFCKFGIGLGAALVLMALIPYFSNVGMGLLPLIGIFGAFACYQELRMIEHYPVYTEYFGGGYESRPLKDQFRETFGSKLRALFRRREKTGRRPAAASRGKPARSRGPAQVVDIEPKDAVDLYRQMLDAVEREDFEEAARLRDLLKQRGQ